MTRLWKAQRGFCRAASLALAFALGAPGGPVHAQQPAGTTVPLVAAGANHTCALLGSGSVFCWGANRAGQAGAAARERSAAPHAIAAIQFAAIASGGEHTCGLDAAGVAWCWGSKRYGQLGDGRSGSTHQPRRVVGGLRFASITAGGTHTCALTARDHRAFCWGDQWDRAAGTFAAGENLREPLPVRGDLAFQTLSAGGHHTCGVTRVGKLFCWGDNSAGQVRPDRRERSFYRPQPLPVDSATFTTVASGTAHTCALTADGRVFCWGSNDHGQLGIAPDNPAVRAGWVLTDSRFSALAAGGDHTCGLTTRGQISCWGGAQPASASGVGAPGQPVRLASLQRTERAFVQVTAGAAHDCAASTTGEIWCWGDDSLHQLGGPGNGDAMRVILPDR